ncbi:hypothetical protein KY290_000549 [Solanum tuberosum]|uniref:Uncharacterized protein n=1 Tax=Solanum tuberosum TaxID=4113 RepID=A0ABQ7WJM1_SOLTU|nr:hypothetical protein KY290_000549 [Solanum tuberosum]
MDLLNDVFDRDLWLFDSFAGRYTCSSLSRHGILLLLTSFCSHILLAFFLLPISKPMIFDSPNDDSSNSNTTSEFKNKPDGWETTSKTQDGNIWEMSQREEDILVQEFERRIAFNKFQPLYLYEVVVRSAYTRPSPDPTCGIPLGDFFSSVQTLVERVIWYMDYWWEVAGAPRISGEACKLALRRRRPIDGWKYMIEEIGPNARKGKGSVSRLPSIADASTRPFREEETSSNTSFPSNRGRTERR